MLTFTYVRFPCYIDYVIKIQLIGVFNMNIVWGLVGIVVVLGIAFLSSNNRKAINPRTILGGLAIQVAFAFIVLKWEAGKAALQWLTNGVTSIINYANEGINFCLAVCLRQKELDLCLRSKCCRSSFSSPR